MDHKTLNLIIRICAVFLLIAVLCYSSVTAFRVGMRAYSEKEGTSKKPVSITMEIKEGAGIVSVAGFLKKKGIIESRLTFIVQKSLFKAKLIPGQYEVNSNMTGRQILDILSGIADTKKDDS